ncbi:MAG: glycogen debranching protein GlgX [Bifidobacteriaceae bacterium]|jgi:glycogen operon protein|nr:glycogen debranching protein GlgX [Bifidobacteriaceae bacterium]
MSKRQVPRRYAAPLGARIVNGGISIAIYIPRGKNVKVCFFEPDGFTTVKREWANGGDNCTIENEFPYEVEVPRYKETHYNLKQGDWGIWYGFFEGYEAGTLYGFRVTGNWDPENGAFYNPNKVLADPYAKGYYGDYIYDAANMAYMCQDNNPMIPIKPFEMSDIDSLGFAPLSVALDSLGDNHPQVFHPIIPYNQTVIYEAHVKGFTQNAPWLREDLRGTYAGLADPQTISYLKKLGVTSLELLPIHYSISEAHLLQSGKENYWGYSTHGFFAPNPKYATELSQKFGAQGVFDEVRGMINLLHNEGIEVIIDVVYNHTCEESNYGPSLSFRGLNNEGYYCHPAGNLGELYDYTGCGNSLDFRNPMVIRMVLDSLRFWANQIGVDGFRFDLGVTTARGLNGFTKDHPLLIAMKNDSVLGNLKLIEEPWDVGDYGWQTGQFGQPFSEWNDRFRNTMRTFWLADQGRLLVNEETSTLQELATRFTGSSDFFNNEVLRRPTASVNYITAHDGFTMRDLTEYNMKHNEANGENNNDGSDDNTSYNHGIEGASEDQDILVRRTRTIRNLLASLILSQGMPMIVAGDEFGRTQGGNNNAYCQDSEISWLNWDLADWQKELLETTKYIIKLRHRYAALHIDKFLTGKKHFEESDIPDISWYRPNGKPWKNEEWSDYHNRATQMLFASPNPDEDDVLILLNGRNEDMEFSLPDFRKWVKVWDSDDNVPKDTFFVKEDTVNSTALSFQIYASSK